jgi:hypothetical protein
VSVFFTGPATRRAALLAGKPLPVLCTLSRDGALLTWTFTPSLALQGRGGRGAGAGAPVGQQQRGSGGKRAGSSEAAGAAEASSGEDSDEAGEGPGSRGELPGGTTVVRGVGPRPKRQRLADGAAAAAHAAVQAAAEGVARVAGVEEGEEDEDPRVTCFLAGGAWTLSGKDYMNQRGSRVSCAAFHRPTGVLVTGTSTGLFDIYQLPEFENLQVGGLQQVGGLDLHCCWLRQLPFNDFG